MDLPKKYSSRYVTVIYAVFIIFFAITLSLFYTSRFHKSSSVENQDPDIREEQDPSDKLPIVTKKIDTNKGPPSPNFESSESDNQVHDETIKAPLSKKDASDDSEVNIDSSPTASGGSKKPIASPIRSQPAIGSGKQMAVIYFSDDSTGLSDRALNKLRNIFLSLLKHPEEVLIIEGYGDSSAINRHNQSLSQLRANIVKGYFVKRGISNSRLKTFWMGSENPAGENSSQDIRQKTHQVEIKIE
jgi:outer membrane protein OmpA-like peptidoglycan-associated protein